MSDKRLPSVTSTIPRDLRSFLDRVRELVGSRGRDRLVTAQDLIDAGLAAGGPNGAITPVPSPQPVVTPSAPEGLTATAAVRNIVLEWDAPAYSGHAYAEIWGASTNNLGAAVRLGMAPGTVFVDAIGAGATRYYWVRFVNVEDTAGPYNAVSGVSATTPAETTTLLTNLAGQVSESELTTALNGRIDLVDGDGAGSVNSRIAVEAATRASEVATVSAAVLAEQTARLSSDASLSAALVQETSDRVAAVTAEQVARIAADVAEAETRADQIAIETNQRTLQVTDAANAALEAVIIANTERVDRLADVALARLTLTEDLQDGLQAEAQARLEVTAVVNQNTASILDTQTAVSTLDSSTASSLSTLVSQVNSNLAAIQSEASTRASEDLAEATQRDLLAAQLRGTYTGSDLNSLASGLLYQERIARAAQDQSLAQQITLLSAGSGDQFDWKSIWYFDAGVEDWTGNGTPTESQGWLRPANQASDAYVVSPVNIGADGNEYGQVRMRIRKVGSPTFAGYLWWRTNADSTWDTGRRVSIDEPTFAAGIGLITINVGWAVLVDRIRIDLSSAQTDTDYFEIDWVAIGRPSPGASSAQLLIEQEARTSQDAALSQQITSLSATVGNNTSLITAEQVARASSDNTLAQQTASLQSNFGVAAASIVQEQESRASADSANAAVSQTILASTRENTAAILSEASVRTSETEALATQIDTLSATTGSNAAAITVAQSAIADLTTAQAQQSTTLFATDKATQAALDQNATALLESVLSLDTERVDRTTTIALVQQEFFTEIEEGLSAEASARLALAAVVDGNSAAIALEQTTRTTQVEALSTSVASLSAGVSDTTSSLVVEQTTRATADAATAAQVTTLVAGVQNAAASLVVEQDARATADEASAAQITTLVAGVQDAAASLVVEQDVRATADEASAAQVTTLVAGVQSAAASLVVEQDVRATADEASAAQITTLAAGVQDAAASLVVEQDVRAVADEASAAQITTLAAGVQDAAASLVAEQDVRAVADEASAAQITTLAAGVQDAAASLVVEQAARATADEASAAQITTLAAGVQDAAASLVVEQAARAVADEASAAQITTLAAGVQNAAASLVVEQDVRAVADEASAAQVTTLAAGVQDAAASLVVEQDVRTAVDEATVAQITALAAGVQDAAASLVVEQSLRVTADQATSGQITTLQSSVDGTTAALAVEASTRADAIDGLEAKYTIKVDLNGYVSGYGLLATANDEGSNSEFIVNADRFAVTTPSTSIPLRDNTTAYAVGAIARIAGENAKTLVCKVAGTTGASAPSIAGAIGTLVVDGTVTWQIASRVPFAVQATPTNIGGQSVPAGVYVDAAYVLNATIQTAQIANSAVDNSKIASVSVGKLTADSLSVDAYIRSSNYSSGVSGWNISGDGTAEFGAASIRGQLTADQINTENLTIKDSGGAVIFSATTNLDYSRVGGTKPPSDADKTSANVAAGITGQGAFATLNQITSGNVATYIAGAAIGFAYIADDIQSTDYVAGSAGWKIAKGGEMEMNNATFRGTLAANTVTATSITADSIATKKLKTNSVSNVLATSSTSSQDITVAEQWTDLLTLTLTDPTDPDEAFYSVVFQFSAEFVENNQYNALGLRFRVIRDSTVVYPESLFVAYLGVGYASGLGTSTAAGVFKLQCYLPLINVNNVPTTLPMTVTKKALVLLGVKR